MNWRDLIERPVWMQRAACAGMETDAFFPVQGGSTREAKEACGSCPVRAECLAYAINTTERFGIWGGMSEKQRKVMRRQRHIANGGHTRGPIPVEAAS